MADMTQYANLQSSIFTRPQVISAIGIMAFTAHTATPLKSEPRSTSMKMTLTTSLSATSGTGFYIAEIADSPRERADLEIANISQQNYLKSDDKVEFPPEGDIPSICAFPMPSHTVNPTRN